MTTGVLSGRAHHYHRAYILPGAVLRPLQYIRIRRRQTLPPSPLGPALATSAALLPVQPLQPGGPATSLYFTLDYLSNSNNFTSGEEQRLA